MSGAAPFCAGVEHTSCEFILPGLLVSCLIVLNRDWTKSGPRFRAVQVRPVRYTDFFLLHRRRFLLRSLAIGTIATPSPRLSDRFCYILPSTCRLPTCPVLHRSPRFPLRVCVDGAVSSLYRRWPLRPGMLVALLVVPSTAVSLSDPPVSASPTPGSRDNHFRPLFQILDFDVTNVLSTDYDFSAHY